ncbi:hypothetical protein ASPCADRAFT_206712 [Aspergillus carbonarius ITEM 5010]|uniref:Uncharacterized protein n=1 Tax=Aspergillus carbonarius (strain ITEM 5010) TaxID=602072 RepID=A0A1R3RPX9_ASPC5|nr:hypothetical protein ASPCADRAFT_206712 [Aspergillus carbonarius ITEM 5010]
MSERKTIYYTFDSPESWQKHNRTVTEIIQGDAGIDNWICNRALPPACHPPPLTTAAIEKLKTLDGVIVSDD